MKLSIGLIAYNHERYIEQAVAGILAQRTDFDYEIIIGEDCSTDRTRLMVEALEAQFPRRIHVLETAANLGMNANYLRTLQACTGEYVALIDGDDFWCDENKLQRQVDFLDQHPEVAISFHAVHKVYEDGSRPDHILRPRRGVDDYTIRDLLITMFIPTCSAVIRARTLRQIPDWVIRMRTTDYPLMLLAARQGKIAYLDEVMAVYRVHPRGAWTSMNMIDRIITNILVLETANNYFDYDYDDVVLPRLKHFWSKLSSEIYEVVTTEPSWSNGGSRILGEMQAKLDQLNSMPPGWEKQQTAWVLLYFLIRSYKAGRYQDAWDCWRRLAWIDARVFKNRGLLVMGAGSAFNGGLQPLIKGARSVYRRGRKTPG